jgi:hypothetical protein
VLKTRDSINSLDDPLMAGPIGPSFDGSLLWQATQFATNTALPLAKSGLLPDAGASLESFEQATRPAATKLINKSIPDSFIERSIGSVFKYPSAGNFVSAAPR